MKKCKINTKDTDMSIKTLLGYLLALVIVFILLSFSIDHLIGDTIQRTHEIESRMTI